jgi:alginate O-acetyltransferase complex protein AlgI
MLFNSIPFLFLFLPVTFVLFLLLKRLNLGRAALALIVVASLIFYGWWDARYLGLLLASILINFVIGNRLVTNGPNRLTYAFQDCSGF